jgi:hypothetical protein
MPDAKDRAQAILNHSSLKPGGRFRHYKGGEYEIVALALKEDTLEPLVIYKSLEHGTIWARTLKNWNESVEVDGKKMKRFRKIG